MTTPAKDGQILKTDTLGRVKTPAARREQLLDEFERSGLSGTKFAELTGLKYQTFASWVQRRRELGRPVAKGGTASVAEPQPLRWLEAMVDSAAGAEPVGLCVQLPGGARLEVNTARQAVLAAALMRALTQPASPC